MALKDFRQAMVPPSFWMQTGTIQNEKVEDFKSSIHNYEQNRLGHDRISRDLIHIIQEFYSYSGTNHYSYSSEDKLNGEANHLKSLFKSAFSTERFPFANASQKAALVGVLTASTALIDESLERGLKAIIDDEKPKPRQEKLSK